MSDGPARGVLARAGSLAADHQPLVVLPILDRLVQALVALAVIAAWPGTGSFSAFAKAAVDPDPRTLSALRHGALPAILVVIAALAAGVAFSAWANGAFLRSLERGRLALRVRPALLLRLAGIYAFSNVAVALAFQLAEEHSALLALVLVLVTVPITVYADFAVVFDETGLAASVRSSLRFALGTAFGGAWTAIVVGLSLVVGVAAYQLIGGPIHDAVTVKPVVLVAALIFDGVVAYCFTCLLVAIYAARSWRNGPL